MPTLLAEFVEAVGWRAGKSGVIMDKRVLICGDRSWLDHQVIQDWLEKLRPLGYTTLIEGEAPGVDSIARDIALSLGMEVLRFPALWDKYGKAAGPIRNKRMLEDGNPDLLVFFHYNLNKSRGTANMVDQAVKADIPIVNAIKDEWWV